MSREVHPQYDGGVTPPQCPGRRATEGPCGAGREWRRVSFAGILYHRVANQRIDRTRHDAGTTGHVPSGVAPGGSSATSANREPYMNHSKAKCRFSTTHSARFFPLGVFAVLTCVFFPCNIQADEPIGATNPVTTNVSFDEPSTSTNETDKLIPEGTSALPTLPKHFGSYTVGRDGDESTIQRQAINDGVIRIKVQGSYEVSIGGVGVARGEGTTTLELDGPRVDRLFRGSQLVRRDIVDAIISLPSTIRSTNETLKMLSDPETQEALRQVESLLRLLPKTTVHSERQIETDSDNE